MIDLIVFSVEANRYALSIDNVKRIIQAVDLITIPSAHELIDGMMSYENSVVKVLNFRKLIGLESKEVIGEDTSKFLFYENDKENFAIKVDNIDDIAHINESDIMNKKDNNTNDEFLELSGVLDIDGVLINVIKIIHLPK